MINWDDMRVFIAVARSGSFSNAGRRIGMDATTVARRTQRLESSLNATLFIRSRDGLQLTSAGMRLAEAGAGIEAAVGAAGQEGTKAATGTVRISVPEGFGTCILAPAAVEFAAASPGLRLEIVTNAGYLSPSTREVDIAITSQPPSSSRLVVERLADYEIGLFGSRDYLAKKGMPVTAEALKGYDFVGFVEDLLYSEMVQFVDSFAPNMTYQLSSSSIRTQTIMAAAGSGLGAFPLFLGKEYASLVRVLPQMRLIRTLWMASHHELCEVSRIRAVRHWLVDLVEKSGRQLRPETLSVTAKPGKQKK